MLSEHQKSGSSAYLGKPNRDQFSFRSRNKYPTYRALLPAGNGPGDCVSLMFEREEVAGFVAYAFGSAGPGSQSARANVYDTRSPYLERGSSKRQMLTPYEQSTAQSSE